MRFRHQIRPRRPWTLPVLFLAMAAIAALCLRQAAGQEPEHAHVVPSPPPQQPAPAPPAPKPQEPAPAQPAPPPQEPQQPAPPAPEPAPPQEPASPASPPPQEPQQPAPPQQQPAPVPPQQAAPQPAAPQPAPAQPAPATPRPAAPAGGVSSGRPAAATASPARPAPAPAGSGASGRPLPAGPLFGETIEVRVVNVEAVVTDKKGNRVPDLKPEDFRLRVDGKPVKIDYFNEVRGGEAIAPAPGAAPTVPGLPDLAPGSPVGTSYLVFIDDYFSVGPLRDQVLRSLRDDLVRLGPEDRMALVAFDGRHLNLLSSWSSSSRELARAIEREIGSPAHGLERVAELRNFRASAAPRPTAGVDPVVASRNGFAGTQLNIEERAYVSELGAQLERAVSAATSTLRGFASPPGRKVMLLLAGGWPFSPAEYAVNDISRPILEHDVPNGDVILRPLVETANRLGYTLYPVDVPGIETNAVSAQSTAPRSPSAGFGLREQEHEGSLTYLAKETGGKALLNSLRIASLEHVEADTRSYYWLGFTPSWEGNDKQHSIRLEVLRPGLGVRTRDSFLDRSRKAEVSMMVESAMLFGNPPGSPAMPLQLGKPVRKGRHEMEVPFTLAIPTDAFTSVPLNGKYASEVELRVAAQDERGNRSDIPVVPLQLSSDKEPAKGHFVRFQNKVTLRRTNQHLIFALFDPLSNKITTAEADIKPD
jgi:VWFA-related protein